MRRARPKESAYQVRLEDLEQLVLHLETSRRPPAPTFAELYSRFMEWSRAQRQKPSTLITKESIWRVHLEPRLAARPINELAAADVDALRALPLSGKRVNCILTVLRKMLRLAVKWKLVRAMPLEIEPVQEAPPAFDFYDFEQYRQLIAGGRAAGPRELAVVLLGGDAGLRMGEMLALELGDVDVVHRQLRIRRAVWQGNISTPKGGRGRVVPMTRLLEHVLREIPRSRPPIGPDRVLLTEAGSALSTEMIRTLLGRAQRAAGLEAHQKLHSLRHTFCSHLAMRGAALLAIKELAGHVTISTTQKYMHLADPERQRAIWLLDQARSMNPGSSGSTTTEAERNSFSTLTPTRFELVGEAEDQRDWFEPTSFSPKRR